MNSLFSFFKSKPKEPEYPAISNLASFKTDIHSHLIPAIDDGVQSMDESLDMIKSMVALGFKKIVTTPHIMSDYFRNTPEIILSGLDQVREAAAKAGIDVQLEAAAEYYLDEDFPVKLQKGNLLTIGGKYLLFEVSYVNPPDNLYNMIFEMNIKGYTPILAHPERYPFWYGKFEEYHKIREAGALFQLNTNSLVGYYGPGAKKIAERMIDENMIEFIGSDLHGQRHLEALQKVHLQKHLWKLATLGTLNASI